MLHRHINPAGYTLPAIDDVISRGGFDDWAALRAALVADRNLIDDVARICAQYTHDPYAQRYHFWKLYAETVRTAA